MKNLLKCFFGRHEYWRVGEYVNLTKQNFRSSAFLQSCWHCGKVTIDTSKRLDAWDSYLHMQELAGLDKLKDTPSATMDEAAFIYNASKSLNLEEMDINLDEYNAVNEPNAVRIITEEFKNHENTKPHKPGHTTVGTQEYFDFDKNYRNKLGDD
jgi:hypothetical protein